MTVRSVGYGLTGPQGLAGSTFVGSVVFTQSALVAINLGIRDVSAALTGAIAGARYLAFPTSYKLNNGASQLGRPAGYAMLDCTCNANGTITVAINAPLLAIGSSYALTCDIFRIV